MLIFRERDTNYQNLLCITGKKYILFLRFIAVIRASFVFPFRIENLNKKFDVHNNVILCSFERSRFLLKSWEYWEWWDHVCKGGITVLCKVKMKGSEMSSAGDDWDLEVNDGNVVCVRIDGRRLSQLGPGEPHTEQEKWRDSQHDSTAALWRLTVRRSVEISCKYFICTNTELLFLTAIIQGL